WLAVALGAAAVISFFATSSQNLLLLRSASGLIPLVLLGAVVFFFFGLARYLTNTDQAVRNNGVHILLWSLLAIVLVFILWSMTHLLQNTFGVQNGSAINVAIPSVAPTPPSSYPSRDYRGSYPE